MSSCLQILSIAPVYSSESPTQVVLLLHALLNAFPALRYVVYDNACGMVRHMRKSLLTAVASARAAWRRVASMTWVLDRLHFTYHRVCQDPASSYFVCEVNPHIYPELAGIDTEAAEHVGPDAPRAALAAVRLSAQPRPCLRRSLAEISGSASAAVSARYGDAAACSTSGPVQFLWRRASSCKSEPATVPTLAWEPSMQPANASSARPSPSAWCFQSHHQRAAPCGLHRLRLGHPGQAPRPAGRSAAPARGLDLRGVFRRPRTFSA